MTDHPRSLQDIREALDTLIARGGRVSPTELQVLRDQLQALDVPRLTRPCPGCAKGLPVVMLDADGTRTDISKRPGVPSHGVDDSWWPCSEWVPATSLEARSAPAVQALIEEWRRYANSSLRNGANVFRQCADELAALVPREGPQEEEMLEYARLLELCDENGITETDTLKHRLEDERRWCELIPRLSATVDWVRRELRVRLANHTDGDVAVQVSVLRQWYEELGARRGAALPRDGQEPQPLCDHKFIDSPHCLKCGWTPESGAALGRPDGQRIKELEAALAGACRVFTIDEACAPDSPFEYDQGDNVRVPYDDIYNLKRSVGRPDGWQDIARRLLKELTRIAGSIPPDLSFDQYDQWTCARQVEAIGLMLSGLAFAPPDDWKPRTGPNGVETEWRNGREVQRTHDARVEPVPLVRPRQAYE